MSRSPDLSMTDVCPLDDPSHFVAFEPGPAENEDRASMVLMRVNEVMKELHDLLEDYAPTWFTEGHHNRTEEALRELSGLLSSHAALSALPR